MLTGMWFSPNMTSQWKKDDLQTLWKEIWKTERFKVKMEFHIQISDYKNRHLKKIISVTLQIKSTVTITHEINECNRHEATVNDFCCQTNRYWIQFPAWNLHLICILMCLLNCSWLIYLHFPVPECYIIFPSQTWEWECLVYMVEEDVASQPVDSIKCHLYNNVSVFIQGYCILIP